MAEAPNQDQFAAFAARAAEGPVAMLNLLKFIPDGGAETYARYMAAVAPLLAHVGGRVQYLGRGGELLIGRAHDDWDLVLVVQYPTRQALLDMIQSPAYLAIRPLRDDSVERSVLLATDPQPIG